MRSFFSPGYHLFYLVLFFPTIIWNLEEWSELFVSAAALTTLSKKSDTAIAIPTIFYQSVN